jgi:peptidoglycan/xylan/chitin deacetylase (PgdA/CDA1 family)
MSSFTKKKIIAAAGPVLSGLRVDRLFRPFVGGIGHILMFHRIIPDTPKERIHNHLSLEITPEHFENTIQYFLQKKYSFYSLDQVHQALAEGNSSQRFVSLTFDDGYKDNYEIAYPIAKKYGVPISVYVTTCMPDGQAILWWYLLEDMILASKQVEFEWEGQCFAYACRTRQEKELAFDYIGTFVKNHATPSNQRQLYKSIFGDFTSDPCTLTHEISMTWEDIKSFSREPLVTIGAHTVNHFALSRMTADELAYEINESKKIIANHIQQDVHHFAYPYGKKENVSFREFEMTAQFGFKTAVTTRVANIFLEHKNSLTSLPRLNINRVSNPYVLDLQTSGLIPFIVHKGVKVITN